MAHVERFRIVPERLYGVLWEILEQRFHQLNEMSPIRQSITHEECESIMSNENHVKFILFDGKVPRGIAIVSNVLEELPWINKAFYQKKFGTMVDEGKLWYVGIIAGSGTREDPFMAGKLIVDLAKFWKEHDGVAALDFYDKNDKLMKLITRYGEGFIDQWVELGSQRYVALTLK